MLLKQNTALCLPFDSTWSLLDSLWHLVDFLSNSSYLLYYVRIIESWKKTEGLWASSPYQTGSTVSTHTHIVHALMFCPRFSQKQSAKRPKNTGECSTTKLKSTCKNSGTFEEKKFHPKKSLTFIVLHQAIQLSTQLYISSYMYLVLC